MNSLQDLNPTKITNELRSFIFILANKTFKKNESDFASCLKDAWFVYNAAVAIFNDEKGKTTNFAVAVQKAKFALILKKGMKDAELNGEWFYFIFMKNKGTERRETFGRAITSNNYTHKGSTKKPSRLTVKYFDKDRNAVRSFRIEDLLIGSHVRKHNFATA